MYSKNSNVKRVNVVIFQCYTAYGNSFESFSSYNFDLIQGSCTETVKSENVLLIWYSEVAGEVVGHSNFGAYTRNTDSSDGL